MNSNVGNNSRTSVVNMNYVLGFIVLLILVFTVVLILFFIKYIQVDCGLDGKKPFLEYLKGMDLYGMCYVKPGELKYEERKKEDEEEPYLIKDQIYTYEEAKHKCKAYNARLATKQDLIKAYNLGMHTPYYGWTQEHRAYQVVQPCEYTKMRRQGYDPAPPGVQGGKFYGNGIKFGVWCYGIKPEGEVVKEKSHICPFPEVCQTNPEACRKGDDNIAPFFPKERWSAWKN